MGSKDLDILRLALVDEGYVESPLDHADKRLIGLDISRWDSINSDEGETIYLESRGFAALVDRNVTETQFGDHLGVARLLQQRRKLHERALRGADRLSMRIEALRNRVTSNSDDTASWTTWEGVPYVFTFYVAEDEAPHQTVGDQDCQLGILALSEPSRVGLGDTERNKQSDSDSSVEIAARIADLNPLDLPRDIDVNHEVFCGATWAGLVVIGRYGDSGSTIATYELLEVRTQLVWFVAYQTRRWCEMRRANDSLAKTSELDGLRWRSLPLLREGTHLSDASMPSRYLAILAALKSTSDLERQVSAAEDAIEWTYQAAERIEAQQRHHEAVQRHRDAVLVEVLLGTVAVLQLLHLLLRFLWCRYLGGRTSLFCWVHQGLLHS